ncbi:uncharacterized protein BX663DRAFT_542034 [Cokeromyces recurvatus]|uniref:uncharacterized protein n=1 Tax=Cokeromyces recurvatus TaxID=90255 RepID=UPI0022201A39|nr:uncharacterized protein BX663DRAFT_542034 [Cokeromyces recurvatus]KAI7904368.1 hypothetical protein BX663DRAFT_542034 [Cokeromyces recurvatus]
MPISFIPEYYQNNSDRRCSDPNLYSLRNTPSVSLSNSNFVYLPPLLALTNKDLFEKHHQFSDTSCQERSIIINKLIDASADIIDSIWINKPHKQFSNIKILSTSCFIREILKRSRATYSMLQLALFYIFRMKRLMSMTGIQQKHCFCYRKHNQFVCCGRRMFLASLIVASKYLNDKHYRNQTWSKIASLPISEINTIEFVFLKLIDYQLYVSKPLYDKWVSLLYDYIQRKNSAHPFTQSRSLRNEVNFDYSISFQNQSTPSEESTPNRTSSYSVIPNLLPLSYGKKRPGSFSTSNSIPTKQLRLI